MAARSKARRRAVEVLYEAEQRRVGALEVLAEKEGRAESPMHPYLRVLVEGVQERGEVIDRVLATYAEGWTLDRMPAVDRNVLRLGTFELLFGESAGEVPEVVAISEAVDLARELSTDDSPGFVNGLLSRIHLLKAEVLAEIDTAGPGTAGPDDVALNEERPATSS